MLIDSDPDPTLPNVREYRQAGTGARYYFDVRLYNLPSQQHQIFYYASRVVWPNGEVITYSYEPGGLSGLPQYAYQRPIRIASSMGYHIDLAYSVQYVDDDLVGWQKPSSATLYRTAEPNVPLRRFTYSGTTITDSGAISDPNDDRVYTCTACTGTLDSSLETSVGTLQLPGETSPALQVAERTDGSHLIQTVTRDGVPWTYSYANLHQDPGNPNWLYSSVTVTGPNGFNRVYSMTTGGSVPFGQYNIVNGVTAVTGVVGAPNHVTSYAIDTNSGRPLEATYPEGNRIGVSYDDAGNVTARSLYARPGSGTLPATITEQAHYLLPANPEFCTTACWRPDWSEDELDRRTDYRYNANGQLTEMSEPADAAGVRRRTVIDYTLSPAGLSRRSKVTICAVTSAVGAGLSTCTQSQSLVTEYEYVGDTMLVSLERQRDMAAGTAGDAALLRQPGPPNLDRRAAARHRRHHLLPLRRVRTAELDDRPARRQRRAAGVAQLLPRVRRQGRAGRDRLGHRSQCGRLHDELQPRRHDL